MTFYSQDNFLRYLPFAFPGQLSFHPLFLALGLFNHGPVINRHDLQLSQHRGLVRHVLVPLPPLYPHHVQKLKCATTIFYSDEQGKLVWKKRSPQFMEKDQEGSDPISHFPDCAEFGSTICQRIWINCSALPMPGGVSISSESMWMMVKESIIVVAPPSLSKNRSLLVFGQLSFQWPNLII